MSTAASPRALTLREWESGIVPGRLRLDRGAHDLAHRLTAAGTLEIIRLRKGIRVRARSHVGRVRVGPLDITIVPKIRGGSLLRLLRYAYGLRNLDLQAPLEQSSGHSSFQDLLIHQLVQEAWEIVQRGLHRGYLRRDASLSSPRGRLDFAALARRGGHSDATLPCQYHGREEDRPVNRVLLAGLRLAASLSDDRTLRHEVLRIAELLALSITPIRLDHGVFSQLEAAMDRTTRAYGPAVTIIRILHDSSGLSLDEPPAGPRLPGFLFDMNRFFETLLGRFLRENLPGYEVRLQDPLEQLIRYIKGRPPGGVGHPTPGRITSSWRAQGWSRSWTRSTGTCGRSRYPLPCSTS